jgi:phosphotransferase system enzyme I (PtsI)
LYFLIKTYLKNKYFLNNNQFCYNLVVGKTGLIMNGSNSQLELNGVTISPGVIIGEVCHYQAGSNEQTAVYKVESEQIHKEIKRFENAIKASKEELTQLAKNIGKTIGKSESKIFETHILLLEDKQLLNKIQSKVKDESVNIENAVKIVFEEFEDIFAKMDDEYLKDRGTDFSELKRRIISHLTGEKGKFLCRNECLVKSKSGRIILTNELTPSMISMLENKNIDGFITKYGGKNSHAAILARAVGIPYITGINIIDKIKCETPVIIDGNSGKVIFNPEKEVVDKYKGIIKKDNEKSTGLEKVTGSVVKTKKGIEIEIYANIINLMDMNFYNELKLAGIGLVRTEFLFFEYKDFPTEEEQTIIYSEITKKANGHPVTFRLFDLGGDKKMPSLKFEKEENPLLGLRGIRYLMKYKKILTDQVNAICNSTKYGTIKIL